MSPIDVLTAAYRPLLAFADTVDDATGWQATALPGWCVRDLIFHLAADCQRALVALATPTDAAPDTDEVSYWSGRQPNSDGALAGLRGTRVMASAWTSVRGPAALYVETAHAVLVAASRLAGDHVLVTQGHRLTVDSLVRTLAVEAAVHHLDLGDVVRQPPHASALREVRHVLDGLLGRPLPASWSDERCTLIGTGRAAPTDEERTELGPLADRMPLFG
jgi:hypothetical protein